MERSTENRPIRLGALAIVIAAHAVPVGLLLNRATATQVKPKPMAIQASLVSLSPQQDLSEPAKPLPARSKPRPQATRAMVSAPLAPKTETSKDAVLAPPPEAMGSADADDLSSVRPPAGVADYLSNPAPEYPRLSRRAGEEGKVVLSVYVSADGKPIEVKLEQSSGFERLDRAALAAVSQWSFVPARMGDKNVDAWVLVPIVFRLKGQP